jgi:hypothetical protein
LSLITDISFIALSASLPAGKAYGMSKSLATARQSTLVVIKTEAGTEGVGRPPTSCRSAATPISFIAAEYARRRHLPQSCALGTCN